MSRSLQEAFISEKHKQWMAHYGRVYKDSEEREKRLKIFKDNVEYIESFNKAANKPCKLGLNPFTDLTNEEFKRRNTLKSTNVYPTAASSFRYENLAVAPSSMDWRNEGATPLVPIVKDAPLWKLMTLSAVEHPPVGADNSVVDSIVVS
ncbi:hypothetical protein Vadar_032787 [Vaccinium darrowii]|uniref:Uncharacterized protein n=1 Tax=Vaccinium darrowii TaxID=229202 RepID=A0ACB7Z935_9ERIC|nr:hypothetical protein Vadar_032787 [Vaccinium darrowii]